jgi:hypothetical protein
MPNLNVPTINQVKTLLKYSRDIMAQVFKWQYF